MTGLNCTVGRIVIMPLTISCVTRYSTISSQFEKLVLGRGRPYTFCEMDGITEWKAVAQIVNRQQTFST